MFTYRRILSCIVVVRILAECATPVELDEELVVIPT